MSKKQPKQAIGPRQEAWLQALESGEYKQCMEEMFDGAAYCCLGVACVVKGMKPGEDGMGRFRFGSTEDPVLPQSGITYYGLRDDRGKVDLDKVCPKDITSLKEVLHDTEQGGHDPVYLTTLNDSLGWSFKRIAKFIRRNPSAVFTSSK